MISPDDHDALALLAQWHVAEANEARRLLQVARAPWTLRSYQAALAYHTAAAALLHRVLECPVALLPPRLVCANTIASPLGENPEPRTKWEN